MDSEVTWQWLLVLLALAVPAVLVVIAFRRAQAEGGTMTPGFKGWLFILAAAVWLAPLRGLAELARMVAAPDPAAAHFPWLVRADLAITGATVLAGCWLLVLMLRRAAAFRRTFPIVAGFVVLSLPLSILVARLLLGAVYGIAIDTATLVAAMRDDIPRWVGAAAATIAWIVYVWRSRRVALTFVA